MQIHLKNLWWRHRWLINILDNRIQQKASFDIADIIIIIIMKPMTGYGRRVAVQLITWPFSSTYLDWRQDRYSLMGSMTWVSIPGGSHLSLSNRMSSIFKTHFGHGNVVIDSIEWTICPGHWLQSRTPTTHTHSAICCVHS